MRAVLVSIIVALLPTFALSQGGIFENLSPGDAVLIGKAPSGVLAAPTVRLDGVCEESLAAALELQIIDALAAKGVRVDPAATIVMRYEISPCKASIGNRQSLAQRDAFQGTSRVSELPQPPSQFSIPFGKSKDAGARLTLNILVYKPGQPPMWNALIAGRSPGLETQNYLSQLAGFAISHWGDNATLEFEIIEPGAAQP